MSKKVLIVDIGNTATEFAVFENGNLQEFLGFFKLPNEIENLKKTLENKAKLGLKLDDSMIFSVVPNNNEIVTKIVAEIFKIKSSIFDWQHYELKKKNPKISEAIGADLLADIKQVEKEHGGPALIADFGTITKLIYLDERSFFEGLSLIPGLETALKSFSSNTALLPELKKSSLTKDRLGLNTAESMYHGIYFSTIYYVKEVLKSLKKDNCKLIITGGNLRYVKDDFKDAIIDGELTLKGMFELYKETHNDL